MSPSDDAGLAAPPAGRRLPRIDYASHPAYGGMFEPAKWLRRQTEAQLKPIIAEVERTDRARDEAFGQVRGSGTDISREVSAAGFCIRQLGADALEPLHQAAAPLVRAIKLRLDELRAAGKPISFKASQEIVAQDDHPEVWRKADAVVREAGLFEAAVDYAGIGYAKLRSVAVMVNQPGQAWCSNVFHAGDFETPPTVGFHIDSAVFSGLKVVLYLSDVGPDQGPFGVIPGSHLWEPSSGGRVLRRAFDRSPFVSRAPGQRHAFASLPAGLQLKAEFGGDMLAGAPETVDLLAREHVATGPRGQLNIFVPEAIHRGGAAQAGERQVMLLSIGAKAPGPAKPEPGA
jgi:hypothetical protein